MELKTSVWNEGSRLFTQLTAEDHIADMRTVIYRRIVDVEDALVRAQLIRMGWTPPSEVKDEVPPDGRSSL